jgi:peptidoglycan hydrolase CwlO-like protein
MIILISLIIRCGVASKAWTRLLKSTTPFVAAFKTFTLYIFNNTLLYVNSGMSIEENPKTCKECALDKSFFQKQIRRLREKLDHSQLRISSLERECERLRDELREAKWNGSST